MGFKEGVSSGMDAGIMEGFTAGFLSGIALSTHCALLKGRVRYSTRQMYRLGGTMALMGVV